jgi:hypothetical protein
MEQAKEDIFKEIRTLISGFAGISLKKIMMESNLEMDLGIYGDDEEELILAYAKKFNVDLSKFNIADHVAPEGDTFIPWIISVFSSKPKKRVDLKVSDLVDGVLSGILNSQAVRSLRETPES